MFTNKYHKLKHFSNNSQTSAVIINGLYPHSRSPHWGRTNVDGEVREIEEEGEFWVIINLMAKLKWKNVFRKSNFKLWKRNLSPKSRSFRSDQKMLVMHVKLLASSSSQETSTFRSLSRKFSSRDRRDKNGRKLNLNQHRIILSQLPHQSKKTVHRHRNLLCQLKSRTGKNVKFVIVFDELNCFLLF